ncbi:hypothetical protein PtA15_12A10 [Puccinia triticina]|uniref:Uncharacterized protein n=1 Tax=Puccinia triticina TaxID=208348 RepID=A0ABY7CYK0_9BASI|nr:uncharacterized protein PtA15_12A10 [Puccinia triticina]WAQ90025.1 hypothetical protein PtA15_12A10 [Puccinia triticina]
METPGLGLLANAVSILDKETDQATPLVGLVEPGEFRKGLLKKKPKRHKEQDQFAKGFGVNRLMGMKKHEEPLVEQKAKNIPSSSALRPAHIAEQKHHPSNQIWRFGNFASHSIPQAQKEHPEGQPSTKKITPSRTNTSSRRLQNTFQPASKKQRLADVFSAGQHASGHLGRPSSLAQSPAGPRVSEWARGSFNEHFPILDSFEMGSSSRPGALSAGFNGKAREIGEAGPSSANVNQDSAAELHPVTGSPVANVDSTSLLAYNVHDGVEDHMDEDIPAMDSQGHEVDFVTCTQQSDYYPNNQYLGKVPKILAIIKSEYQESNPELWTSGLIIRSKLKDLLLEDLTKSVFSPLRYWSKLYFDRHLEYKTKIRKSKEILGKYQGIKSRFRDIVTMMCIVNLQFLVNVANKHSGISYLKEQKKLASWFTLFLRGCDRYLKLSCELDPGNVVESEEVKVYHSFLRAVHANIDISAYQVSQREQPEKPLFVSKPRMQMYEAAVEIVGYYYGLGAKEHRASIVGNGGNSRDEAGLLKEIFRKKTAQELEDLGSTIRGLGFPASWRAFFPTELLASMAGDSEQQQQLDLAGYTSRPVFELGSLGEVERSTTREVFEYQNSSDIQWAWISRVQIHQRSKFHRVFQPTSGRIVQQIKARLAGFAGRTVCGLAKHQILGTPDAALEQVLDKVFVIVWEINKKFLQSFCCEVFSREFMDEQKRVQLSFLACFREAPAGEGGLSGPSRLRNEKILRLIVEALVSSRRDEKRFVMDHPTIAENIYSIFTAADVLLAKAGVHILGDYYKSSSGEKWEFFFEHEESFFRFLMSKSAEIYNGTPKSYSRETKTFEIIKQHKNIPWKDPISPGMPPLPQKLGRTKPIHVELYLRPYS